MINSENETTTEEEPCVQSLHSLLESLENINKVTLLGTELLVDSVQKGNITQRELKAILLQNLANAQRTMDLLYESKRALQYLNV